jgi:hypothetical protein
MMRLGFTVFILLPVKELLSWHRVQLKLVFRIQYPEGESLPRSSLIKLLTFQRYQRLLLEPFINQLNDVELTNDCFQQDSATAHNARMKINYWKQQEEKKR